MRSRSSGSTRLTLQSVLVYPPGLYPLNKRSCGSTEALAGVFAAKEAVCKALGTGIGKVHWQDIEIIHAYSGEPEVRLHGTANEVAAARHLSEWAVSITHDGGIAMAVAVARD